jgi:hypothetical protein
MQTTYYFNRFINYHYDRKDISDKNPDIVYLFSDDPYDYKTLSKIERINKTQYITSKPIKMENKNRMKMMQYIYTCNPKLLNPIFEIRLKYLKYGELHSIEKDVFCDAQHSFQVLYRFINKMKFNKMRKFDNEHDLCLIPFSSLPYKNTIWLFENSIRFQFNIRDLLKIIVSALSTSFFMFENAKMPKNPFTNVELTVFQLHLIYIRLCELKIKIPIIFELFYKAQFVLSVFKKDNVRFLTECAIETHYSKDIMVTKEKIIDILEMINDFCNQFMMIRFHKNFPIKIIYDVFRPYLILRAKYLAFYCAASKEKLCNGLKLFHIYNPMFGYKYIDENGDDGFDDRHISYGEIFNKNFYGIETPTMIETFIQNKTKYGGLCCVGIPPIENVQYILMKHHNNYFSEPFELPAPISVVESDDETEEDEDDEEYESDEEEEEEEENYYEDEDDGNYDP